jgi:type I restriction enzyme S subunit
LYYYTLSSDYAEWLKRVFIQTTIQNINAEKYKELNIPYISIEKQAKLVSIIQNEQKKNILTIENIRDKINLLQEYRIRLISDVVTGKINVKDKKIPNIKVYENESNSDEDEGVNEND